MNPGELFENAIEHWKDIAGKGTALIPAPLEDKLMVLGVLQRVYARSPTCKTVIIVDSFNDRTNIIEYLTQQEGCDENNAEFKKLIDGGNIRVFTASYIEQNEARMFPFLCIVYRPITFSDLIYSYVSKSKFKLIVLNKLIQDPNYMTKIYKVAPLLSDFKQAEVEQIRLSTPVEECMIPIDIPEDSEEAKLLTKQNEYINTSLSIFGSFDVMNQANLGNAQLNISSNQICQQIAQENGWQYGLDMSIPFNVQIDSLYNPMALKERASKTYEIIRNRSQLVSDYEGKLESILEIVRDNQDKKILIINKRADFATTVTHYINNLSETNICMSYHDKLDNIPAIDADGLPLYYKTGLHKGERKMMGAQAQRTLAIKLFNSGIIRVLSTNNAPDKDLDIDVDIIIITSPLCEELKTYIYRLSKISFRNNKIELYSLYCRNTLEEQRIDKRGFIPNRKVSVKSSSDDENNYDFVVRD